MVLLWRCSGGLNGGVLNGGDRASKVTGIVLRGFFSILGYDLDLLQSDLQGLRTLLCLHHETSTPSKCGSLSLGIATKYDAQGADCHRFWTVRGADVKAVYLVEQTTLHMSAVRGAIEVAYLLFEECYRVNASDIDIREFDYWEHTLYTDYLLWVFKHGTTVRVEFGDATAAADPAGANVIARSFPHTYGQPLAHFFREKSKTANAQTIYEHPAVKTFCLLFHFLLSGLASFFCGRQSPRGHNVVWGLHEALKIHNPKSTLLGFLGGSEGGYDLLGRTKDQIRTTEQVKFAMAACKGSRMWIIAYSLLEGSLPTQMQLSLLKLLQKQNALQRYISNNLSADALSAEKYYYYIRIMGRKASHVAVVVECTLQSSPTNDSQYQVWNPRANQEGYTPSTVEVLMIIDETLDAFFQLPIPTHPALLPDLIVGLDRCLQYYTSKAKSGCGIQQLCESTTYKIVFHDLSHSLWDALYVGELSSSAIKPVFAGFACGSRQIEDDFKPLRDLFWANGDGLPMDVINKFSATARDVIRLFRTETETFIERFRRVTLETYGSSSKSRLPLPAITGQWSPSDPNTLLRNGQALSTRPDILPSVYCTELAKLQDQIPPFSTKVAICSIETQLGAPVSQLFADISPEPMAAAFSGYFKFCSLSAYRELVAVKVQRPGMSLSLTLDALLFNMIGGQLKRFANARKDIIVAVNEMSGICLKKSITSLKDRIVSGLLLYMVSMTDTSKVLQAYTYVWCDNPRIPVQ
ncbi:pyrophosphate--fructose 6-phosphate 1-phosphotransferase subunit alpha [Tanacetum coccineum]